MFNTTFEKYFIFITWRNIHYISSSHPQLGRFGGRAGKKLNRVPVAQDHNNLALASEKFQTVAQLSIEILNISCITLIAGPQEILLGY